MANLKTSGLLYNCKQKLKTSCGIAAFWKALGIIPLPQYGHSPIQSWQPYNDCTFSCLARPTKFMSQRRAHFKCFGSQPPGRKSRFPRFHETAVYIVTSGHLVLNRMVTVHVLILRAFRIGLVRLKWQIAKHRLHRTCCSLRSPTGIEKEHIISVIWFRV